MLGTLASRNLLEPAGDALIPDPQGGVDRANWGLKNTISSAGNRACLSYNQAKAIIPSFIHHHLADLICYRALLASACRQHFAGGCTQRRGAKIDIIIFIHLSPWTEWDAETIAQNALDRDLITERDLRDVWGELGAGEVDPEKLKQFLLRREFVTNYQLERLLKGERSGFFYGPYKVLYLVGTGTFARVFRAMHRETRDVRAVKVLRNRLLGDQAARDQFIREGEMGARCGTRISCRFTKSSRHPTNATW